MAPDTATASDSFELENYDVDAFGIDTDSSRFDWFADKVATEIVRMLLDNAQHPRAETSVMTEADLLDGVLDPQNVRDVTIRDKPLADARVTVWLNDAPLWANTADTRKLVDTSGRNDCHVVVDVRPA